MRLTTFLVFLCVVTFFSCKENKAEAQKSQVEQKGTVKKLAAADFKNKVQNKTVQLIDVRTPGEYNIGHIANAKNVNFYDANFLSQLNHLDKKKPVYLYCKSGGRSGKASIVLRNAGFNLIYDLKGGFTDWKTAGLPIIK